MNRSEINAAYRQARACFKKYGWALPPHPCWDITDFGLGDFNHFGLTLVVLASEPEYCEKLMFARMGQTTPCHAHARKKEDIICRAGTLAVRVWPAKPSETEPLSPEQFVVNVDGLGRKIVAGEIVPLDPGQRITLNRGIWHAFFPTSEDCVIGEVSTANDDLRDNFFLNPQVGRFPDILEDEPAEVPLLGR
jgi:D-lyxose ketol-isomerase